LFVIGFMIQNHRLLATLQNVLASPGIWHLIAYSLLPSHRTPSCLRHLLIIAGNG